MIVLVATSVAGLVVAILTPAEPPQPETYTQLVQQVDALDAEITKEDR